MSSKLVFSIASLIGLSFSLPTNTVPLACSPEWQECEAGTWFYTCANGYRGCFSYDPCSLPPLATTTTACDSPASVSAPPSSTPTSSHVSDSIGEVIPEMYNIYLTRGEHPTDRVPHIDVRDHTQMQVAYFQVPDSATNCNLRWRQPAGLDSRSLRIEGSEMMRIRMMLGFPSAGEQINSVTIQPFLNGTHYFQPIGFSGWPESPTVQNHSVTDLDCSQSPIVVEMRSYEGSEELGPTSIFMENNEENGFFMSYTSGGN